MTQGKQQANQQASKIQPKIHPKIQPYELILASGSPRRQQLLAGLGLQFRTVVTKAPETVSSQLAPDKLVETLAKRKAEHAHALLSHSDNHFWETSSESAPEGFQGTSIENTRSSSRTKVIIAADTVVVRNGEVLGKPVDAAHAIRTLEALQGQEHTVYTGVCVMSSTFEKVQVSHSATKVRMRKLSREQIIRYVNTGEPMDKAGAYGIQSFGATLIESIHGDYFTVVGLPLAMTVDILEEFGISIWPSPL